MSIDQQIREQARRGLLFPVLPLAAGETTRRAMFVTEELQVVLQSPTGDVEWEERVARLQADLEVFVTSPTIDPSYLFLLFPARDKVWEIRSTRDAPSIRVFGFFANIDVFIGTNFGYRADLGSWESREWKESKRCAGARWRQLFNGYQPRPEIDAKLLVTGALDGRYFKTPQR
jgi:hypothetical protein